MDFVEIKVKTIFCFVVPKVGISPAWISDSPITCMITFICYFIYWLHAIDVIVESFVQTVAAHGWDRISQKCKEYHNDPKFLDS